MKAVAMALLLLLAAAAAEEVSMNRALQLALVEYPEMDVQPVSKPSQLAVTPGGSYWIIEFDEVWVPVSLEGKVLKEEREQAIAAYGVHHALKAIIGQRDTDQYPVKKDTSLTLLQGDVESKESYLTSYKSQLPDELKDDADRLIAAAGALKNAIKASLAAISGVRTTENQILYYPASYSDFESWRGQFGGMLDAMETVAVKGYAYDDMRVAFGIQGQLYMNSSDDTAMKQAVQAFAAGIAIPNVPGSLPGLESTVTQWRDSWLEVALTDEKVLLGAEDRYVVYREYYSGETVASLRGDAYAKVQGLATTVPLLVNDLSRCSDELTAKQQSQLGDLNETYSKASKSYTDGAGYEKALRNDEAKEAYLNAISWADDAKALEAALADVSCPARPTTKPDGNPIMDFVMSPLGLVAIGLAVALVALYLWNNRKKGDANEAEYVPSY